MAASTGHSRELSRRWRLAQLSPYCHKDISVNPGVLYRSGKKTRGPPGASKFITNNCNLPYFCTPRKECFKVHRILGQCKKGRTHHCLYTWNFHILHLELKTTFPGPNFCCFFCKQNSHASFVIRIQHCLDRKGYHHFSWGLSIFSRIQKFPAFQSSY